MVHNILKQIVINTNTLQIKTICLCYFVRTWIRITVSENVGEIGTCYSKCETVEQIRKRGYGNNFVFAEETDFILEKRTTKHPDKKTG